MDNGNVLKFTHELEKRDILCKNFREGVNMKVDAMRDTVEEIRKDFKGFLYKLVGINFLTIGVAIGLSRIL